jgi:hypothetical protein
MKTLLILGLVWLTAALIPAQAAQDVDRPRVSATQTPYLSCTVWNGHEWTQPAARSAQTPVIESAKGARAYAEVKVAIDNGICFNTTTLYIADGAGKTFTTVYIKSGNGNGIHIIGWSPNGDELLAEVNVWRYQTDIRYDHFAVLYHVSSETTIELPELNHALLEQFGSKCQFERTIQGWKDDGQILVKISKSPADASYEQHFCVERDRIFVFDVQSKALRAYQNRPSKTQ